MYVSRQYRTHGLLYVTDKVYEVSPEFEQALVSSLNTSMLQIHGENHIQEAKYSSFKAVDADDACEFDEYVKDENQVVDRATSLLTKFKF